MKKLFLLLALIVTTQLSAVNYCASSSWGYAGTVTGGGSASPTLVSSASALESALGSNNKVIIITQDITVTNHISTDKSNLTIMALPGKKLISNQQNKDKSGILYLKGSNIILRNLTFEGPGAYDCDGWDLLCLDGAKKVWVDHCDFQDGCDGNFDIKGTSDNITVTWCRFRYLKAPKAGGSGGSADHRFSNLVGSSSTDKPSDGTYNITYGFCWWDEGCVERMTRCRNSLLHFINCYWNSSVSNYYVCPEYSSCYFEGCTFAGNANTNKKNWKEYNGTEGKNYCKFVNCSGNSLSNAGSVSAPSYSYDKLTAADAKTVVTNSSCGAGATLTVTNTAEVSSSCDNGSENPGGEQGGEQGGEGVVSDFWNFSDSDFNGLGIISSETVVRDLHIVASSSAQITIDRSAKTVEDINFTHRLKFGGAGNETARHLWFDVTGDCSITVYLTSSSGTGDARTLNISTGSFNNVVSTMSAPAGSVNKDTYNYTGPATRIYLYSAASGINLYGVKLTSQGSETANKEVVFSDKQQARKIIREGRILILRDNKTYDLTGRQVD